MATTVGFIIALRVFSVSSLSPRFEQIRRHLRDAVPGQDAADGEHRRQEARHQQAR
jgi:hypothetical protein